MSEEKTDETKPTKSTSATRRLALAVAATALATAGLVGLLINVFEKKTEARNPFFRVVELNERTDDPAVWGRNFPLQYDGYRRTVDMQRTRWGGSEAMPHAPTARDPRTDRRPKPPPGRPQPRHHVERLRLRRRLPRRARPRLHAGQDQETTERQVVARQPGTCLHCHASMWTAYDRLGNGDIFRGFEAVNHMPYAEARTHVQHPVACIDCHDPATMALRVTRPALHRGDSLVLRVLAADPTTTPTATRRTRRCARTCAASATSSTTFAGPTSA
jgi:nitrite reductase (cytochrome c-552)